MKTFTEQDLCYMCSEPNPQPVLDLIAEDRKKARGKTPERETRKRYSPLREHVSQVSMGGKSPRWLCVRLMDGLFPDKSK